ncbi:hypothetical protein GCM10029978_045380 [Actinoallomurus acanthiterrae]
MHGPVIRVELDAEGVAEIRFVVSPLKLVLELVFKRSGHSRLACSLLGSGHLP